MTLHKLRPTGSLCQAAVRLLCTLLTTLSLTACITACITADEWETTPRGDFEALWTTIDRHYCFFDYKRAAYGLDWDEVYRRYAPQVSDSMPRRALFQVLGNMCAELRDGHVNLWTGFDVARYAAWHENYPTNYSDSLERRTLGSVADHKVASGLPYRVLRDNIGYLRCPTFENEIGTGNLHEILRYLATCDGLIIDVRNNGGGRLTAARTLASAFCNTPTVVGYMAHKTGAGHHEFSQPRPIVLQPAPGLRWQKPVVVLTNRNTYSAANVFVAYMRALPRTTQIGDTTGGGSGMPFSSELPSGWSIRFSACPLYDHQLRHTEFGIDPDIDIDIIPTDYARGTDTILERGIDFLKRKEQEQEDRNAGNRL